jgi:hypothetical protein
LMVGGMVLRLSLIAELAHGCFLSRPGEIHASAPVSGRLL